MGNADRCSPNQIASDSPPPAPFGPPASRPCACASRRRAPRTEPSGSSFATGPLLGCLPDASNTIVLPSLFGLWACRVLAWIPARRRLTDEGIERRWLGRATRLAWTDLLGVSSFRNNLLLHPKDRPPLELTPSPWHREGPPQALHARRGLVASRG